MLEMGLPLAIGDVPLRTHQLRSTVVNALITDSLADENDETMELDIIIRTFGAHSLVSGIPTYLEANGVTNG
mgnify:CR=1 FL=1